MQITVIKIKNDFMKGQTFEQNSVEKTVIRGFFWFKCHTGIHFTTFKAQNSGQPQSSKPELTEIN